MKKGLLCALIVFLADQISKICVLAYFARHSSPVRITPFFNIVLAWNKGVSFSMFHSNQSRHAMDTGHGFPADLCRDSALDEHGKKSKDNQLFRFDYRRSIGKRHGSHPYSSRRRFFGFSHRLLSLAGVQYCRQRDLRRSRYHFDLEFIFHPDRKTFRT